jgi:hypothetical protein
LSWQNKLPIETKTNHDKRKHPRPLANQIGETTNQNQIAKTAKMNPT